MRHKSGPEGSVEKTVKNIRRATRKRHATEEKIRIVLEGKSPLGISMECHTNYDIAVAKLLLLRHYFWI